MNNPLQHRAINGLSLINLLFELFGLTAYGAIGCKGSNGQTYGFDWWLNYNEASRRNLLRGQENDEKGRKYIYLALSKLAEVAANLNANDSDNWQSISTPVADFGLVTPVSGYEGGVGLSACGEEWRAGISGLPGSWDALFSAVATLKAYLPETTLLGFGSTYKTQDTMPDWPCRVGRGRYNPRGDMWETAILEQESDAHDDGAFFVLNLDKRHHNNALHHLQDVSITGECFTYLICNTVLKGVQVRTDENRREGRFRRLGVLLADPAMPPNPFAKTGL